MRIKAFPFWTAAAGLCLAQTPRSSTPPSPLLDANGNVRQESYLTPPVPSTDRAYAKIDGRQIKEKDIEVTQISLRSRDDGNKYWGRIAGTKYEKMTAQWAEAKWKQYGLTNVHEQEYDLEPQWFALDWNVTATGNGKTVSFKSLNPSVGSAPTPPQGIGSDIVWVGTGSAADFMGRDVRGKAVLILSINPATWANPLRRLRAHTPKSSTR